MNSTNNRELIDASPEKEEWFDVKTLKVYALNFISLLGLIIFLLTHHRIFLGFILASVPAIIFTHKAIANLQEESTNKSFNKSLLTLNLILGYNFLILILIMFNIYSVTSFFSSLFADM